MPPKKATRKHESKNTQYFVHERSIITGQVLAAQDWRRRWKINPCNN
jgi:hypothetical protein